ncbi:MaoC/PaaZ C-terminal domain-containing protein [Thermodesulfobacteriota bacterium]
MEIGYELPAVVKKLTVEKIYAYTTRHGDWFKNTIHTNLEIAKKAGFPNVVCQGNMLTNYISELLLRVYREHSIQDSQIKVTYIKSAFPGEIVSAKGVVKEKKVLEILTHLSLDVWVENESGEKLVTGSAKIMII